mgnify:CR=1 FL=1
MVDDKNLVVNEHIPQTVVKTTRAITHASILELDKASL